MINVKRLLGLARDVLSLVYLVLKCVHVIQQVVSGATNYRAARVFA